MRGGDPAAARLLLTRPNVFPACAGVILVNGFIDTTAPGFPRMRGGDPQK